MRRNVLSGSTKQQPWTYCRLQRRRQFTSGSVTRSSPSTHSQPSSSSTHQPSSSSASSSQTSSKTSSSNAPSLSRLTPGPRPSPTPAASTSTRPPASIRYNPSTQFNPDTSFNTVLSHLPSRFGANQQLTVTDETRKMLEGVVATFNAPIRYAFAYGSGIFQQTGYGSSKTPPPMLDFIFAVSHADHWHSINMHQNPSHYSLAARLAGSGLVTRFQNTSAGLWFNPYAKVNGVTIKYGVTTIENLTSDLLTWRTLYLAGRMHKPIRIIKDDPRIRLTQQVNLASAVRTALLLLPEEFTERELFEAIAWLSYLGDARMSGVVPLENRNKVTNIVEKQQDLFRELYWRLASGIQGVEWQEGSHFIRQDNDPKIKVLRLRRLPAALLQRIEQHFRSQSSFCGTLQDESAFWLKVAGEEGLKEVIEEELKRIVRWPSFWSSAKGVVTAGVGRSLRYGVTKLGKWWKG